MEAYTKFNSRNLHSVSQSTSDGLSVLRGLFVGVDVSRVRIWLSDIPGVANAFLVVHDDDRQDSYPLKTVLGKGDRLGSGYKGDLREQPGTYYDLPAGFPTSNETAKQRLNDPSIPATMKKLIVDNFPRPVRPRGLIYS